MGFKVLENGWEFYSISEELKLFSEELYGFLSNIAPSWFVMVFLIFMAFFVLYTFIYIKMYMKTVVDSLGGI